MSLVLGCRLVLWHLLCCKRNRKPLNLSVLPSNAMPQAAADQSWADWIRRFIHIILKLGQCMWTSRTRLWWDWHRDGLKSIHRLYIKPDEQPLTSYFDVHQGRVLIHSQARSKELRMPSARTPWARLSEHGLLG